MGFQGHIHRERLNHIPSNKRSRGGGLNGRGASRARAEGVLEGDFGRTELGDVLLEVCGLATVFDEETSVPFIGDLYLLDHSVVFNLEGCDLAREFVGCGSGSSQSVGPCREVRRHRCEVGLRVLVLGGETYVLGREFGVCLRRAFLVVVP